MRRIIALTIFSLLFISCQDIIEVDLNNADPRLVVEGNIHVSESDGTLVQSEIRLTLTAPFFDNEVPSVENASVEVVDELGNIYPFNHAGDGYYFGDISLELNTNYRLQVIYEGEVYTASTTHVKTPSLEYIEQRDDGGFLGDQIELKVYFQDFPNEDNYYYVNASSERGIRRNVIKDEFYDGNMIFSTYVADDLAASDHVRFALYGITEEYYNYMFILLQQTGGGGGPFETQPATVRGNIINESNPENYPLGYFRISEVSIIDYIVE